MMGGELAGTIPFMKSETTGVRAVITISLNKLQPHKMRKLISFTLKDIVDIDMRDSKSTIAVTIRNIPVEIHRALRVRAAQRGHSTEAEIRLILEAAVKNEGRVKLGSLLAQIGRECGGVDLTIERDRKPTEPVSFE